jgi:hypothetical protein
LNHSFAVHWRKLILMWFERTRLVIQE